MIQRPRLFTSYDELPEIISELEILATDLKTISTLQTDSWKNWELEEAYQEIARACHRLVKVYDQSKDTASDGE